MSMEASVDHHEHFMRIALQASLAGVGFTEPNPLVGAVVTKNGRILATGCHRAFGREHAEIVALAAIKTPGTDLYVTLEPCSHFGKTPPCVDLIIRKKVRRVFAAQIDPNPLVNGRGVAVLKKHGIQVSSGLLAEEAAVINRHYFKYIREKIPYVMLHAGLSLDGKMTDRNGASEWVTSAELRALSHSLRGECSAILAGANTVRVDNPRLTIREAAWGDKKLLRVVLDRTNTLDPALNVFREQDRFPLVIFSSRSAEALKPKCDRHFFIAETPQGLDMAEVLTTLGELGVASVLVEGGGLVLDTFIRERLFDEIVFFFGGRLLGGRAAVAPFPSGVDSIGSALELKRLSVVALSSGFVVRGFA